MAPRKGGSSGGDAGYLAPSNDQLIGPALKRLSPWVNNVNGDIIAGTVDANGNLQGTAVTDTSLMTILRYFQLSASTHPKPIPSRLPPDQAGIGQALSEGCPVVIVTRGFPGRGEEVEPKSNANEAVKQIWHMCRFIRSEMPGVHITTVDVPAYAPTELVSKVLQPPLSDFRELAYFGDSWYVPDVVSAPWLAKALREEEAKKKKRPEAGDNDPKIVKFDRKAFTWNNIDKGDDKYFKITWRMVAQDPIAPPAVAKGPALADTGYKPAEKKATEIVAKTEKPPPAATAEEEAKSTGASDADKLISDATSAIDSKDYDAAKKAASEAVKTCRVNDLRFRLTKAYIASAQANLAKGHVYSAMNAAKQAVLAAQECGDEDAYGEAMAIVGSAGDYNGAAYDVGPKIAVGGGGGVSYM
eukprot:gnl/TRDRNA2_/TRDRNA2_176243_c0_seq1.p1 gnl/TRDRNA2_/TRDRNA2_176243_c0~~gnl/TRDRNA2_/TRDRNA2_176243_c0_seq1.p1  ORF type:complete len:414 (-),score=111.71 gnl/TRDRNA2_/TRDRNA2_176243_c0_seq1:104-1345(-)